MGNENADNERKKHHRGRRRKKKGNIIANVILVIALIVFCVSGFQLFKIGKGYLDGRSEYDKVRKLAVTDDKNKNDKDKNHSEDGDDTFSVDFQNCWRSIRIRSHGSDSRMSRVRSIIRLFRERITVNI